LNRRVLDDLVRRWRTGWSLARDWNDVVEDDGVLVVRIGRPDRSVEYIALAADQDPDRVTRAVALAFAEPGTAWLTLATADHRTWIDRLSDAGLVVEPEPEWLMTIELPGHANHAAAAPYEMVVERRRDDLVGVRAMRDGATAASGWLAVAGTDAVVDRVVTDVAHRRRGLGSAVMSALVGEAMALGAKHGLLVATADGRRLYESLGWSTAAGVVLSYTKPRG
jgi:GNAT superfamily N-acetyltransferase